MRGKLFERSESLPLAEERAFEPPELIPVVLPEFVLPSVKGLPNIDTNRRSGAVPSPLLPLAPSDT